MKVNIDQIIVPKRIRKDLGDLSSLANSMDKHGQLNPITITAKRELIAGERRLEAAKLLGWETITVNVVHNLDEIARLEMEIDENQFRKEFTQQELVLAKQQLDKLKNPSFLRRIKNFFINLYRRLLKK